MSSITAIAKAAGVSVASVSRVFNDRPNVRPEVRDRVLACARELGYRPRQTARRDAVALVTGELGGGYAGQVAKAMLAAARRRAWRLDLLAADDVPRLAGRLLAGVVSIVPETLQHAPALGELQAEALPMVTINHRVGAVPCVRSDDRAALRDAVGYLYARGHRRMALLTTNNESLANTERRAGYMDGLRHAGLSLDPALVQRCTYPDEAVAKVAQLLQHHPDALIATGEGSGPIIAQALDLLGRKPGSDLSLISHELPGTSPWLLPAQTTIAQDFDGLAEHALAIIAGELPAQDVVLPCLFHERRSVLVNAKRGVTP